MSETTTTGGMYPPRNECCHGRLKRQCNECDLQEENQQLKTANKELLSALEMIVYDNNSNDINEAQRELADKAITNAKQVMGDSDG